MKTRLLVIISFLFLAGCKYVTTGVSHDFAMRYESGVIIGDWLNVSDKDDLRKLSKKIQSRLRIEGLDASFTTELIVLRPKRLFKRKDLGINVFSVMLPAEQVECIKREGFTRCKPFINSDWYRENLGMVKTSNIQSINEKEFLVIERETKNGNKNLTERIALTLHDNRLFIFEFYAPSDEFENHSKEFQSILSSLTFDRDRVAVAIEDEKAGFLTGLWHGILWVVRWLFSWVDYVDVWPDNNTGLAYVIGFFIGLILLVSRQVARVILEMKQEAQE